MTAQDIFAFVSQQLLVDERTEALKSHASWNVSSGTVLEVQGGEVPGAESWRSKQRKSQQVDHSRPSPPVRVQSPPTSPTIRQAGKGGKGGGKGKGGQQLPTGYQQTRGRSTSSTRSPSPSGPPADGWPRGRSLEKGSGKGKGGGKGLICWACQNGGYDCAHDFRDCPWSPSFRDRSRSASRDEPRVVPKPPAPKPAPSVRPPVPSGVVTPLPTTSATSSSGGPVTGSK